MDRDPASVLDIVIACRKLSNMVAGRTEGELQSNEMLRFAVLYLIAMIGETAYRLSDEFRDAHSDIPWGDIMGIRNRVIHGYDRIKLPIIWVVASQKSTLLIERLEPLLPTPPEESPS